MANHKKGLNSNFAENLPPILFHYVRLLERLDLKITPYHPPLPFSSRILRNLTNQPLPLQPFPPPLSPTIRDGRVLNMNRSVYICEYIQIQNGNL